MNSRPNWLVNLVVLSTGFAGFANAQQAPPPPLPEAMREGSGPEFAPGMPGDHAELLGFEGLRGAQVVTGAPFSAVSVTQTTHLLADGNKITRTTQTNIYRDSLGRVRKEITLPAAGPFATSGQSRSLVVIHDPVASANFVLHADTRTVEKLRLHVHGDPKGLPGGSKPGLQAKLDAWMQRAMADGSLKKEELGTQTVAGVPAQGTRITRTIPAGQIGNEKPITVVSERWYSNDLQMLVMTKRSDPRFGETVHTVTGIQRSEPAPSLFTVPSDYTAAKPAPRGRGGRGIRPGPPPPPAE